MQVDVINTGASAQLDGQLEERLVHSERLEHRLQERAECGKCFYSAQWIMMMMILRICQHHYVLLCIVQRRYTGSLHDYRNAFPVSQ